MERSLTQIRDVDLKILSELDDRDLLNYCKTHKYGNELCNNEDFWRNRLQAKFPGAEKYKSPKRTWKNYYLKIIYYLNKYESLMEAMLAAVRRNEKDIVQFFILKGGPRWTQYDWNSGLYRAAQGGHVDLMKFFIQKGADELRSSLYAAALGGHKDAIDYLISQRTDLNETFWLEGLRGAQKARNKDLMGFFGDKIYYK